jgi:hypothetical protein
MPLLEVFGDVRAWPTRLRQVLLTLPDHDAKLLEKALAKITATDLEDVLASYREAIPRA